MINLMQGDCLERMKEIPSGSVDMILTDPPYGTTACKWDSIIPLEPMWEQLKRIIKPNGAIVMTASQPFTTKLIASNIKMFRYEWIWQKTRAHAFNARIMPLKKHENVCVFYSKKPTYNAQKTKRTGKIRDKRKEKAYGSKYLTDGVIREIKSEYSSEYDPSLVTPISVVKFKNEAGKHPTQKPVALMEYLIKTYTNENETVLDFTMGSGTTGVACVNTGRNFIGIELDDHYFEVAKKRIQEAQNG